MIPKVGDIVKLNPDFLKVWFRRWKGYMERKTYSNRSSRFRRLCFFILFKSKDYDYYLHILSNGESGLSDSFYEYEGIQVFIPANISKIKKDNIYCSCGGPKKENWIFCERFYICINCKKEVI